MNDVLDRSKLQAGKMVLELVSFNLHELLASSMELFSTIATGKGLGKNKKKTENTYRNNKMADFFNFIIIHS